MSAGVIVQARTGSTRLPGKVLLRVQGHTLLGHLLRRLGRAKTIERIVVATTTRPEDEAILEEARRHGALTSTGSEEDVLSRYLGAAREHDIDPVVRVTSDCPLHDPMVLDRAVALYSIRRDAGEAVDLVTNGRPGARTYPRGLDTEVAARRVLEDAHARMPANAPEREHVTQYLYRHAEDYRIEDLRLPIDLSFLRWTVDTGADYDFVREVYDALYPTHPEFGMNDVLALLSRRPELVAINAQVRQKGT